MTRTTRRTPRCKVGRQRPWPPSRAGRQSPSVPTRVEKQSPYVPTRSRPRPDIEELNLQRLFQVKPGGVYNHIMFLRFSGMHIA